MDVGRSNHLLFFIGLFSGTHVHVMGSIGISELIIFLVAPFIFLSKYDVIRREGFAPIAWLSLVACFGCFIASILGDIYPLIMMKGIASPYAVFSCVIVLHTLLRHNFGGLKWILLGMLLSSIINVFIFQPETDIVRGGVKLEGAEAVAAVTGGVLFWSSRLSGFLTLPIKGWYLKTPMLYSVFTTIFMAMFFLLYSGGSGRSAALALFMSAVLLMIGKKSAAKMHQVSKHFVATMFCLIVVVVLFRFAYQYAAPRGWLGEDAIKKYERLTMARSTGFMSILISGRLHTFTGLRACFDKPFLGFGAKAIDRWGYTEDMLHRYGNAQDYENYINTVQSGGYHAIPAHSHIISAWLDSGISGLVLWCYILYLIYRFFTQYVDAVPMWYGYFALALPRSLWDIFFSPFGGRVGVGLLVTCLLLSKAVRTKRLSMPFDANLELTSYGR